MKALTDSQKGFSLTELLVATLVFGAVVGTTLQLLSGVKLRTERSSDGMDLEQQGRQAVEVLIEDIRNAGLSIYVNQGTDQFATRQPAILEASPYRLAFYADAGPLHSPLDSVNATWPYNGEPVRFPNVYAAEFPDGSASSNAQEYFAKLAALEAEAQEVPAYLRRDAEVIVYTLDTDGNGAFDPNDKKLFNAGATANPSDAVLRRLVFGTSLEDGSPVSVAEAITVARGVRVFVEPADLYPNGRDSGPLFVYHLAEKYGHFDLDGNGKDEDQLIFGDCLELGTPSCGDGVLQPAELTALLGLNAAGATDLADSFRLDKRFDVQGPSVPDLLTRIQDRHRGLGEQDAKQFLRNCISRIGIRLLIEDPDTSPRAIDPRHSAPGKPYRYLQHELEAMAYLPNAFFLSKNQLLAAEYLRDRTTSDSVRDQGEVYDPQECFWPSDPTPCWPTGPGSDKNGQEGNPGSPNPASPPDQGDQASANEGNGRIGPGNGNGNGKGKKD
jgi:prepilin-type N-terminal cleavage/methylation domain-containing protein